MSDTAFGYLILGTGILLVLGLVFVVTSSRGGSVARPRPPSGVHLPNPSPLPVVMSVGAALLGAGLAFRDDGTIANLWLAVPGLFVLVYGVFGWVRAAGREWHDTERAPHDDSSGH
jgi:hypothetical protein